MPRIPPSTIVLSGARPACPAPHAARVAQWWRFTMPVQSKASVHSSDSWGYQLVNDVRSCRTHYVSTAAHIWVAYSALRRPAPKAMFSRIGQPHRSSRARQTWKAWHPMSRSRHRKRMKFLGIYTCSALPVNSRHNFQAMSRRPLTPYALVSNRYRLPTSENFTVWIVDIALLARLPPPKWHRCVMPRGHDMKHLELA